MGSVHGLFFTLYLILAFPCRKFSSMDDATGGGGGGGGIRTLAAFFPLAMI